MSIIRIARADEIRPAHAAMILLACAVLAGTCLLTNGPKVDAPPDGGRAWEPNSWLPSIVGLMNLEYTQTTANGIEIKSLVFAVGTALALVIFGLGMAVPPTTAEAVDTGDVVIDEATGPPGVKPSISVAAFQTQLPPLLAAQVLMLMYVGWSFLSMNWAASSTIAFGGSMILLTYVLWSLALAHGLNRRSAHIVASAMVTVLALTSVVAIWYHAERNPSLRAGFPLGNPLFLAACLIPGILHAVGWAAAGLWGGASSGALSANRGRSLLLALISLGAMLIMSWAFKLTGGRGPFVGLVAGLAILLTLVLPTRFRWWVGTAFVVMAFFLASQFYQQATEASATGRDATIRTRLFAWDFGIDLLVQKPFLGHGQGGYTLLADALAVKDGAAERDPIALNARIAHAHNEWLQVLTELGPVGFVLLMGSYIMTFVAGMRTLRESGNLLQRATIAALLASVAAILLSEAVGVGLRVAGLPAIFYTLLGLVWAVSADSEGRWSEKIRAPIGRTAAAVICGAMALLVGVLNYNDYQAARDGFEVSEALVKTEWDQAVRLSDSAAHGRLDPQRRLHAVFQSASVHLYIAEYHLDGFRRRLEAAGKVNPPDPRLIEEAKQYAQLAESHQRAGMSVLKTLNEWSPLYWSSGETEAGLHYVRAQLLASANQTDGAQQETLAAAGALEQDILRRPFEPGLVLRLIDLAGPAIPPEQIISTAARPLRASLLFPEYTQMLLNLADVKQIREPLEALLLKLNPPNPPDETAPLSLDKPETWPHPWMPEILRWAAIIRFRDADYPAAQALLMSAAQMYEHLEISSPLAQAHTVAELANSQFSENPDEPAAALKTARQAEQMAPLSEAGRQLARKIREVSLRYELASCEPAAEQSVRQYIQSMAPYATESDVDYHLGSIYGSLALSFTQREQSALPTQYGCWAKRASELNPQSDMSWRLMADAAFQQGDDAACVQHLRKALELGADPRLVTAFVQLAMSKKPESVDLKSLHAELIEKYRPDVEASPESLPKEPAIDEPKP